MGFRGVWYSIANLNHNRATFEAISLANRLRWHSERALQRANPSGIDDFRAWEADGGRFDRISEDASTAELDQLRADLALLYSRRGAPTDDALVQARRLTEQYEHRLETVGSHMRTQAEEAGVDAARAQVLGLILVVLALVIEGRLVVQMVIGRIRRHLQVEQKVLLEARQKSVGGISRKGFAAAESGIGAAGGNRSANRAPQSPCLDHLAPSGSRTSSRNKRRVGRTDDRP